MDSSECIRRMYLSGMNSQLESHKCVHLLHTIPDNFALGGDYVKTVRPLLVKQPQEAVPRGIQAASHLAHTELPK
jgi:hypothetical protein